MDIETYEEAVDGLGRAREGVVGDLCVVNTCSLFIRGLGGFGFKGKYHRVAPVIPPISRVPKSLTNDPFAPVEGLGVKEANFTPQTISIEHQKTQQHDVYYEKPVRTVKQKTSPQTAHIYRLCGDGNPLHIDPDMGKISGFKRPILHGLCHFGISAKVVVQTFLGGDHRKLKNIRARFTSHFFPGETLVYKFWTQDGGKVLFVASTEERGKDVIKGEALLEVGARL
jgi:acyl dehydratase